MNGGAPPAGNGTKVAGVVIGSRKCGTTWLYENFRNDPDLAVSREVKESGFFARADDLDYAYYERLFPVSAGTRIEVDSSLVYSDVSSRKMLAYNPCMKIALILRDPVEFAVSRYFHLLRKGQVSAAEISSLVMQDETLNSELDYPAMLARFEAFQSMGSLLTVPYRLLEVDPERFYETIKTHLVGPTNRGFRPALDRVNVSRSSKWRLMTSALSRAAVAARKRRLHSVVNLAKGLKLHKLLEKRVNVDQIAALREDVSRTLMSRHGASVDLYRQVESRFAVGRD
jgi:hypothetical protein